jgi:hypothetical protein
MFEIEIPLNTNELVQTQSLVTPFLDFGKFRIINTVPKNTSMQNLIGKPVLAISQVFIPICVIDCRIRHNISGKILFCITFFPDLFLQT